MTLYTDSLSNLQLYRTDFYRIAVSSSLPFKLQFKVDAWFNELSPSKKLSERFERVEMTLKEFFECYSIEMRNPASKGKILWIKEYSKKSDVVLLCYEPESDNNCHRHVLKTIIENS